MDRHVVNIDHLSDKWLEKYNLRSMKKYQLSETNIVPKDIRDNSKGQPVDMVSMNNGPAPRIKILQNIILQKARTADNNLNRHESLIPKVSNILHENKTVNIDEYSEDTNNVINKLNMRNRTPSQSDDQDAPWRSNLYTNRNPQGKTRNGSNKSKRKRQGNILSYIDKKSKLHSPNSIELSIHELSPIKKSISKLATSKQKSKSSVNKENMSLTKGFEKVKRQVLREKRDSYYSLNSITKSSEAILISDSNEESSYFGFQNVSNDDENEDELKKSKQKLGTWLFGNSRLTDSIKVTKNSKILVDNFSCDIDDGSSVTRGLVQKIGALSTNSRAVSRSLTCTYIDHYASSYGDKGWGCGYRNAQMLISALLTHTVYKDRLYKIWQKRKPPQSSVPSISRLQSLIEEAWSHGFDSHGSKELEGRLVNTRKWIGATDVLTLMSFLRIKCELAEFYKPTGAGGTHPELFGWVLKYFENSIGGEFTPPLYLQHQGHSRTIMGVEVHRNGSVILLVLDPSHSPQEMMQFHDTNTDPDALRLLRMNEESLKERQYQIMAVVGTIDTESQYQQSKNLCGIHVPQDRQHSDVSSPSVGNCLSPSASSSNVTSEAEPPKKRMGAVHEPHRWQFDHLQQHTRLGERPYICYLPDCGRKFVELANLQEHMKNHQAETARDLWLCPICGAFVTKPNLVLHLNKLNHEPSRGPHRRKTNSSLATVQNEILSTKRAISVCQTELTSLKAQNTHLEMITTEKDDIIRSMERHHQKLLNEIDTHKKIEKDLQQELNRAKELNEKNKLDLLNFYQDQVEFFVRDKLREFQSQLDKAESSQHDEMKKRELTIAKSAASHIQQISDKHALEVKLLEEKHSEEVRLYKMKYKMKLSQSQQYMKNLQDKLDLQHQRKSDMAKQLHKLMEAHWLEALKIINNGKSPVVPNEQDITLNQLNVLKTKSYNNLEEVLSMDIGNERRECENQVQNETIIPPLNLGASCSSMQENYDNCPYSLNMETPLSSRLKNKQQIEVELQKYVQMLLNKQPGNPTEANKNHKEVSPQEIPTWQSVSQDDRLPSKSKDRKLKKPWK